MKNRIKYLILWALALVICIPKGMAQGFVEPTEHVREYLPDEGFTNVTLFELAVYGNESDYSLGSIILQTVNIQLDPSNFGNKISNARVSIYYEKIDTSDFYDQDVVFNESGNVHLFTNFPLYKKKFVQKLKVTGDINTNNLNYGDRLNIKVSLGMGIDGVTPDYYYPEIQSLIYHGGTPSAVKDIEKSFVKIFPNPFVNQITVNLPTEDTVIITNATGETVYTGRSNLPIDASSFAPGLYFIRTATYEICKVIKH